MGHRLFKKDSTELVSGLGALQFISEYLEYIGNFVQSTRRKVMWSCVLKKMERGISVLSRFRSCSDSGPLLMALRVIRRRYVPVYQKHIRCAQVSPMRLSTVGHCKRHFPDFVYCALHWPWKQLCMCNERNYTFPLNCMVHWDSGSKQRNLSVHKTTSLRTSPFDSWTTCSPRRQ